MEESTAASVGVGERSRAELKERARRIECVSNEIFTVKYWQFALDIVLGASALVMLVLSMVLKDDTAVAASIIAAVTLLISTAVYNIILRRLKPMSILQYTAIRKDRRYCFQVFSKTHSLYSDGERAVETDKSETAETDGAAFPQYAFDFFAAMDVKKRVGRADREIFEGSIVCDGKRVKCKIVFRNGEPYYGSVGGVRIKYFDVNDTREKFVVPTELKRAADSVGLAMPKLPGVYYR